MPTKKNIRTPEIFYNHFAKYKAYCKNNPKKENFFNSKLGKEISVSREIPLTWNGFEIWLRKNGIITRVDDYKANREGRYSEYVDIIHTIDNEIYEDKFTGAVVGIYQHNIIARDLGLTNKQDIDVTSKSKELKAMTERAEKLTEEAIKDL